MINLIQKLKMNTIWFSKMLHLKDTWRLWSCFLTRVQISIYKVKDLQFFPVALELMLVQDRSQQTLLHLASSQGHIGVIELLLDKGADVSVQGNEFVVVRAWAENWFQFKIASTKLHFIWPLLMAIWGLSSCWLTRRQISMFKVKDLQPLEPYRT